MGEGVGACVLQGERRRELLPLHRVSAGNRLSALTVV